ncbi:formate dehydrogenase accessory protein FdhE [Desulfosporosinus sp. SB140]|uniref:formate dehydrogenase accessory protein FdhE domain-containing protein n=1 Tax=Desulfosporosinus paludis TaxID=3115649 RepID=UPI0038902C04
MNELKKMVVDVAEDNALGEAYQTYTLLKEEIRAWREERGSFWLEKLNPADIPPYFPLGNLPETAIFELWLKLNRVMGEDTSEFILRETWLNLKVGRSIVDVELLSTLRLALSGIAQLARSSIILENRNDFVGRQLEPNGINGYEGTSCPVCGEKATLSVLTPPQGKRFLHCSLCGQEWPMMRVGCIRCGWKEASEQNYLYTKDYPGIDLVTCEACGQYFKEFDLRQLTVEDLVWEDMKTLPLNYAAEQWLSEHAHLEKIQ